MSVKHRGKFFYTINSIILGLLVGAIILLSVGINPIEAYKVIFLGALGKPKFIGWTIVQGIPIILTGISVAFAFNTGLFNIGAEGQYIVGSLGAVLAGVLLDLPPVIHGIVALLCGLGFGLLWAGMIGLFKAKFGVNEVISSIMLNWVALYLNNFFLEMPFLRKPESDNSYRIMESASIRLLDGWKRSEAGRAMLKEHSILKGILNPPIHWGIILAILMAILAWYILKKTTLGYQLKAVGFNKDAAEYGGINIKKNIIVSMAISGGFSGLAGAITVLGVSQNIGILAAQQGYGFNGIAVSLIAGNSPLACIPAGLLFSGLTYGGGKLNSSLNTPSEIINIIIGIIVFFIAMPKLLDIIENVVKGKRGGKNA
ncbi:MAG: ABC transporter permease [Tissierellia bacterium]|nr:ABC transporter permease [Tissierellia bacterium]